MHSLDLGAYSGYVRKFGVLDRISSFPYETMLCKIKKKVRTGYLPLSQITRRIEEGHFEQKMNKITNQNSNKFFLINNCKIIPSQLKNSCVILKNGEIGVVEKKIGCDVDIKIFTRKTKAFSYPCDSRILGISKIVRKFRNATITEGDIDRKCMIYPIQRNYIVAVNTKFHFIIYKLQT